MTDALRTLELARDRLESERAKSTTQAAAIELAYGLLWIVGCNRSTESGAALYVARGALLEQLDKDGQARGITAARKVVADKVERLIECETCEGTGTYDRLSRLTCPKCNGTGLVEAHQPQVTK